MFYNSSGVPASPLLDPNENLNFSATGTYPRYSAHLTANSVAPYLMDILKFGQHWQATLGLRYDHFTADYNDINYSVTTPGLVVQTDAVEHTHKDLSYRGALTYQPE